MVDYERGEYTEMLVWHVREKVSQLLQTCPGWPGWGGRLMYYWSPALVGCIQRCIYPKIKRWV